MKLSSNFMVCLLTVASLILLGSQSLALDISAYYLGSCRRVVGIPVAVDRETVRVLTVHGRIETVPRYEVNLVATYPSDMIQIDRVENPEEHPPIEIMTRRNRQTVNLVTGWPVEFTDDKVSFLTIAGEDFVVDRNSIWEINEVPANSKFTFRGQTRRARSEFVHPQLFSDCPADRPSGVGESRPVVPQQILAEPVTIKREFDRLMRGHNVIEAYQNKQQFYAVPSLYKNQTSLIVWTSAGSRYGASSFRSNNFTPLIRNEESTGPFSYQHEILTGSGPNPDSVHDESQTQASYRFKSDYFQFSAMSDLSFLLVGGARYRWSKADSADRDYRVNDVARLSAGIDYGHFSLAIIPIGQINTGAAADGSFDEDSVAVSRVQVSARYADWSASLTTGGGDGDRSKITMSRANFKYQISAEQTVQASWITRSTESTPARDQTVSFQAKSNTIAGWYEQILWRRIPVGLNLAYEMYEFNGHGALVAASSKRTEVFLKASIMFGLIF